MDAVSYTHLDVYKRQDLFGLYYLPDDKMVELGLTPDGDAFKAEYYTYMMKGLMTQLVLSLIHI